MTTLAIKIRAEEVRDLAFGDISADFAALGDSFENAIRIFHIQNLTDKNVYYSFDGVLPHGVLAPGGFILLDLTANKTSTEGAYLAVGTIVYIKTVSALPTSGNVYLSVYYAARE